MTDHLQKILQNNKNNRSFLILALLLLLGVVISLVPQSDVLAKQNGFNELVEAERLNKGALSLYQSGQYAKALEDAKKVLEIRQNQLGPDHPTVARSLNNLAVIYESMGFYKEAEPLYKRALDILEKDLVADQLELATILTNLAGLYYSQKQFEKAEPLYRRAKTIREKALGEETRTRTTKLEEDFLLSAEKSLSQGKLLHNVPRSMRVGESSLVELRISRDMLLDLSRGLAGSGTPVSFEIRIADCMSAQLKGEGEAFDIEPQTKDPQVVPNNGFAEWRWSVLPKKAGRHFLFLDAYVVFKVGDKERMAIKNVFKDRVEVESNHVYSLSQFVQNHWEKLLGFIISSGLIGWLAAWLGYKRPGRKNSTAYKAQRKSRTKPKRRS